MTNPESAVQAELAVFAAAPEPVRHAAQALSVTVGLPFAALTRLVQHLWDADHTEQALLALGSWPLLRRGGSLDTDVPWELHADFAAALSADFRVSDPTRFRAAHEWLIKFEEAEAQSLQDDDLEWYVLSRTAFYLAGVDADASADRFADAFKQAPRHHVVGHRIWLSDLALRQEPLLAARSRDLAFYRGFRHYLSGERRLAESAFGVVLDVDEGDAYEAIAGHLLGVIRKRQAPEEAERLFRESVALSSSLGLRDNELMARNSLVWHLVSRASTQGLTKDVVLSGMKDALSAARANVAASDGYPDRHLRLRLRRTAESIGWLVTSENRRRRSIPRTQTDRAAKALLDLYVESDSAGDLENAGYALNDAIQVFRDGGDLGRALAIAEHGIDERWSEAPDRLDAFGKTLASIARLVQDAEQLVVVDALRRRVARLRTEATERRPDRSQAA